MTVVVEIDTDFVDETAPTGLTTAGHIELRDAIGQVGTVAHISRTARVVPAPPVPPVTSEKTRAYGRRRDALDKAAIVAGRQQVGQYDANVIVRMARTFEEYLKGDTPEAGA